MKTLDKLIEISEPHGVTIDFFDGYSEDWGQSWSVVFDAPEGMGFNSSGCRCVGYHDKTLRGIVGYIREELSGGFFKLDPNTSYL